MQTGIEVFARGESKWNMENIENMQPVLCK